MVRRKLNIPVAKLGMETPAWFVEYKNEWFCNCCHMRQKDADIHTVAVEMVLKKKTPNVNINLLPPELQALMKNDATTRPPLLGRKVFLCIDCAEKYFRSALENIENMKALGPEAYDLMRQV